jgi:hypothetical protein
MQVTIDSRQIEQLRRSYSAFSDRRFNAGLATALTRAAQAVKLAQQAEMRDVFDRPSPYTLGSVFVDRARADKIEARVGIANSPGGRGRAPISWLRWQINGGQRTPKAYERALMRAGAMPDDMRTVPGKFARLDAFGNISAGQIRQILSQLRIELSSGATSTLPRVGKGERALIAGGGKGQVVGPLFTSFVKDAKAKQRRIDSAYRRAGGQYVAFPNGRGKLRAGIYQVRSTGFGRTDPKPVLIYVKSANYEAGRYDFHYVSELAVQRNLPGAVNQALQDQLRRWAAKQGVA